MERTSRSATSALSRVLSMFSVCLKAGEDCIARSAMLSAMPKSFRDFKVVIMVSAFMILPPSDHHNAQYRRVVLLSVARPLAGGSGLGLGLSCSRCRQLSTCCFEACPACNANVTAFSTSCSSCNSTH